MPPSRHPNPPMPMAIPVPPPTPTDPKALWNSIEQIIQRGDPPFDTVKNHDYLINIALKIIDKCFETVHNNAVKTILDNTRELRRVKKERRRLLKDTGIWPKQQQRLSRTIARNVKGFKATMDAHVAGYMRRAGNLRSRQARSQQQGGHGDLQQQPVTWERGDQRGKDQLQNNPGENDLAQYLSTMLARKDSEWECPNTSR